MLGMHDFDVVSNYIIKYIDKDFILVVSEDVCVNSSGLLIDEKPPSRDAILSHLNPEMKPGERVKTIMAAYGVSRRTVYYWFAKYKIKTKNCRISNSVMPADNSSKLEDTKEQKIKELLLEIDRLHTENKNYKQQLRAANGTQKDAKIAELMWELQKYKK